MKISSVLLAGGESRRMGRDKATLRFGHKPLWKNQLDLLRKLEPSEIFVSARTDPSWRPAEIEFVADASPSRGPLSGLAAALKRMRSDHLLVLAIDMPFMSEECLRQILNEIGPGRGVIPVIGDRFEPLSAVYPIEVSVWVEEALAGEDFSLQTLVRRLVQNGRMSAHLVTKKTELFYRNLNRETDFADCRTG